MKKHILIIISLVTFISSCSDKFDVETIDFKVELLDDVSPVKVRCTVNGNWDYVRWGADGGVYNDYKSNTFEYVFVSEGTHTIEMSTWKDNTKYIGEKEITIPEPATKLKVSGFQLTDLGLNSISLEGGSYTLEIDYYNETEYDYISKKITIDQTSSGVVILNNPIILDIDGFFNSNYIIYVRLKTVETNPVEIFRSSNWFIEGPEVESPEILRVRNLHDDKFIYLTVDWMP